MIADPKVMPQNIEAEKCVIGSVMHGTGNERVENVLARLKPESFYLPQHRLIYAEMQALNKKQMPVDLLTLATALDNKGVTESVGGFAYLAELSRFVPSAANITAYADEVRDKAMLRYGIEKTTEMMAYFYESNGLSAAERYEAAQRVFTDLADHARTGKRTGYRPFMDWLGDWSKEVDQRFNDPESVRGLTTGIPGLDALMEPKLIVRGSLFVIGARPKMGKTTILQQMAINCALVEKKTTLLFSLEMPGIQMVERTISQLARVNSETFYPEKFDDMQFSKASAKAMELAESGNIFMDDTPGITLSYIQAESRRLKREKGSLSLVLVDYLTLMKPEKSERTSLGFGLITQGLKNLAKELGCAVVLLTQLNRGVEGRSVKRPRPSDSRETGSIEQDCDYWVGIHADEDENGIPDLSLTEYILSLNRHGRTGICYAEQRNGLLYELDQYHAAEMARTRTDNKNHKSNKRGGF
ncbi:DnaB-like helicase C-terminal domain-containing protein [Pantoea ananatis]|uniref:DnaB-like helicase C-terminal domain-containing protein n=1 Tax=Pantoea ananas TaxID=553 RepID=UPI001B303E57|nr:DnaB-like helicase C-terminal domain-containing protein [Pantoea ananatis]